MYILELVDPHGQDVRLELITGEGPISAERAESAVRRFLQAGSSVRVYHADGEGIRMVAECRERSGQ